MELLIKTLIVVAAVALVLAMVGAGGFGPVMGITAEGLSRASSNLALLAIALAVSGWGKATREG